MRFLSGWLIAFLVALAAPAPAQTPPSYAVTYMELKAGSVAAGKEALRAYAASARKEDGNLQFEAFQETARPSRFAIIEAWSSRAALDQHFHDAATSKVLDGLAPMRSAPDDRRMYDGLYASAPANHPGAGLVYVMTHVDVMPPYADGCAGLLKAMRADTPHDHGNIAYNVLRQEHEPNHFTVSEFWASRQDQEAHLGAAHTVSFRQKLLPMTGALYDERIFTEIE